MKNLTTLLAIATLTPCIFTIAHADTPSAPRSETVQFADLNTSNAPGAAVLYRRIKRAAESVCSGIEAGHELALHMLYAKCVHTALSKAVADVNSPAVSAYAAARGVVPAERTTTIARNQ